MEGETCAHVKILRNLAVVDIEWHEDGLVLGGCEINIIVRKR